MADDQRNKNLRANLVKAKGAQRRHQVSEPPKKIKKVVKATKNQQSLAENHCRKTCIGFLASGVRDCVVISGELEDLFCALTPRHSHHYEGEDEHAQPGDPVICLGANVALTLGSSQLPTVTPKHSVYDLNMSYFLHNSIQIQNTTIKTNITVVGGLQCL